MRQEADLCPCKEFCCSCEVGRPETESQMLCIQADSDSAAVLMQSKSKIDVKNCWRS